MPKQINEASTMNVRARFYNAFNEAAAPSSVRYLIRDVTNDRVVRDWTTVNTAPEVVIEVSAQDNELDSTGRRPKRFEQRVVTVQANAGLSTQHTEEVEYWLRNLKGVVN